MGAEPEGQEGKSQDSKEQNVDNILFPDMHLWKIIPYTTGFRSGTDKVRRDFMQQSFR